MANLKPITEVPCVDKIPEGATVLLEVGGAAKRIAAENANFGSPAVFTIADFNTGTQLMKGTEAATAQELYNAFMGGYTLLNVEEAPLVVVVYLASLSSDGTVMISSAYAYDITFNADGTVA